MDIWPRLSPDKIARQQHYYPIEMESQIISLVSSGKTSKLSEALEKLEQNNKHIMTHDYNAVFYNLLLSMNSTLIRIFNESLVRSAKLVQMGKKISAKLDSREDLAQTFYLLREAIMALALYFKDENRQANSSQQSQILQYIDEHYTDPQLSLITVASVFQITEFYLSHSFKHISGDNFSKYVENLRVTKAKELIERGFKITEVAQMCGYNSCQVFRRAYKRRFGVNPSENTSQQPREPGPDNDPKLPIV